MAQSIRRDCDFLDYRRARIRSWIDPKSLAAAARHDEVQLTRPTRVGVLDRPMLCETVSTVPGHREFIGIIAPKMRTKDGLSLEPAADVRCHDQLSVGDVGYHA